MLLSELNAPFMMVYILHIKENDPNLGSAINTRPAAKEYKRELRKDRL
jgi:hypothetical protein